MQSLANQDSQNFSLYVGDDCSPNDPVPILDKFQEKLDITYKRFDERLGNISLTKQWERCLDMVQGEEWVWFLPDDDLPAINCVKEFYLALNNVDKYNIKVFRFPSDVIDGAGAVLWDINEVALEIENNYEFYSRVVGGEAGASLGDVIYNKAALEKSGRFVEFPKAWGSDHATIIRASGEGTLCFLKKAKFSFRLSGANVSSDISDRMEKISARIMFAKWMKDNESLFSGKPDTDFYKNFHIKGEALFVYNWPFELRLWRKLYELSVICHESYTPIPVLRLLLIKILVKLKLRP